MSTVDSFFSNENLIIEAVPTFGPSLSTLKFKLSKAGNRVTMDIMVGAAANITNVALTQWSFGPVIPAKFRPSSDRYISYYYSVAGFGSVNTLLCIDVIGEVIIFNSGPSALGVAGTVGTPIQCPAATAGLAATHAIAQVSWTGPSVNFV
jgi:hypothetical protein